MIRILVIDESPFFVAGLQATIGKGFGIVMLGSVKSPGEAASLLGVFAPDVILSDTSFANISNNASWQGTLLKEKRKVIFLTQRDNMNEAIDAYRSGAMAYLNKSVSPEELVNAIKQAHQGRPYFSAHMAADLARLSILGEQHELSISTILTEHELQLLRRFGDGLSEKEVANETSSPLRTVTYQKATLKKKLNVTRNSSLTKIAIKEKLISIDDLV